MTTHDSAFSEEDGQPGSMYAAGAAETDVCPPGEGLGVGPGNHSHEGLTASMPGSTEPPSLMRSL